MHRKSRKVNLHVPLNALAYWFTMFQVTTIEAARYVTSNKALTPLITSNSISGLQLAVLERQKEHSSSQKGNFTKTCLRFSMPSLSSADKVQLGSLAKGRTVVDSSSEQQLLY